MIQQDYILLILNCEKYAHKATHQKNTWLQNLPKYLIYYHVIGNNLINDNEFAFDHEQHVLRVNAPDDYNSLPKKVCAAHDAVCKTFNFKYVFKTDDDQSLNTPRFFDFVTKLLAKRNDNNVNNNNNNNNNNKIHYGGNIINVQTNYLSKYYLIHPELPTNVIIKTTTYCSGRFYLLSKEAIDDLRKKREIIEQEYLEDYAVGFNLDNTFKLNMLQLNTSDFFTDIELRQYH